MKTSWYKKKTIACKRPATFTLDDCIIRYDNWSPSCVLTTTEDCLCKENKLDSTSNNMQITVNFSSWFAFENVFTIDVLIVFLMLFLLGLKVMDLILKRHKLSSLDIPDSLLMLTWTLFLHWDWSGYYNMQYSVC